MNAVAEARGYIADFIDWSGLPTASGLVAAAEFFRMPKSSPRKIYYGEVKGVDGDRLDLMREIHEGHLTKLRALKEQNDENQRKINELIYRRNELKRHGSVA